MMKRRSGTQVTLSSIRDVRCDGCQECTMLASERLFVDGMEAISGAAGRGISNLSK
jgi:hypothetical protein